MADSSVAAEDRGYTYDTAWNLNFRTNNGSLSTFIPDNKNQLTNAFLARNFYDSNGNMTNSSNNHNVLVYNDENQLVSYFHYQNSPTTLSAGDTRTDFVYDGLSRLRKRIEWVVSCPPPQSPPGGAQPNSGGGGGNGCTWGEVSETWYVYDGMRVIQEREGLPRADAGERVRQEGFHWVHAGSQDREGEKERPEACCPGGAAPLALNQKRARLGRNSSLL